MIFHSVKLINYKSIGTDSLSEILIEPRITPIIGKNESGKSNVLSGLSHINFTQDIKSAFVKDNINRNSVGDNAEIKYNIVLKPTTDELKIKELCKDTVISITANRYEATGGIVDYYLHHVSPAIVKLCETLGANPFQLRDQEYQNYTNYITILKKTDNIDIRQITLALNFINTRKDKAKQDIKEAVVKELPTAKEKWDTLLNMLPSVFYNESDKALKSQYKYEDIKKEFQNSSAYPDSLLSEFLKLIQISKEEFLTAAQAGITGQKTTIRKKIQRNIDSYINKPFSEFYDAENIYLSVDFDSNVVYFSVQSNDGQSLLLSERSNGLRWYLNTFINAKAKDIANSSVLYLFDEPGISLHVNAQRELLELFNHLADKGNQVVYTTHSPYMLNTKGDGIHRIRAVVKSKDGNTSIYKTAYDARISQVSQKDTLAPIINALGMNLYDTFGPAKDKVNIVTEGMSDYIYLRTMAKILDIDMGNHVIIPAFGASNCVNICSILHGWGCLYVALFDYDKAGVETGGEIMRAKMMLKYRIHFFYINDVSEEDIANKTYKQNPYMVEDLIIRNEIDKFCKEMGCSNADKTLTAKIMSNAILSGKFQIGEKSKDNFRELFDRILHL